MGKLTRKGEIVVRVYGTNWRDVTICTGLHADKTTEPPPHGGKPHTILSAAGRTDVSRSKGTPDRSDVLSRIIGR
jgi:hypothetical protein